jgi:prophage regulatory protein
MENEKKPTVILRRKDVEKRTGLSRSTIYEKLDPTCPRYDPKFPKQINLGGDMVGWIESEIEEWILERIRISREGKG